MGGGGGSQSSGESQSKTTPGFMAELGAVLNANLTGKTSYGKDNAIADVQGKILQQATDTLQSSMPKITSIGASQGAYGSTTQKMLSNDLQARIMGQAAATTTDAIKDYAAIDADRIRAFSAATQAGTSSEMQHWENASSRNGDSILDRAAQGVVGGALGAIGDATGLQDGGVVPKKFPPLRSEGSKSVTERELELKLKQQNSGKFTPSGVGGDVRIPDSHVAPDAGMIYNPERMSSKPKLMVKGNDDNDLFDLIGSV